MTTKLHPAAVEERIDAFVADKIYTMRRERKISQGKIGEACGVTFQQAQKMERGMNRVGAGRLYIIAKLFGVPVADFFPKD